MAVPVRSVHAELMVIDISFGKEIKRSVPAGSGAYCLNFMVYEFSTPFCSDALVTSKTKKVAGVFICRVIPLIVSICAALEYVVIAKGDTILVFEGFVHIISIMRLILEFAGIAAVEAMFVKFIEVCVALAVPELAATTGAAPPSEYFE